MRRSSFAALALAATGCIFPSEPVERLELSLAISSDRVIADSGLGIRLVALNPTNETLRIAHLAGCLLFYHIVPPPDVELPGPTELACSDMRAETEIGPGDSVVLARHLSFAPTRSGWWLPGHYQVIGSLRDLDGKPARRTAPVEFELVCRDQTWDKC